MDVLKKSFDGHIVNKTGENVPFDSITGSGKVFGLYFSAHWCPPCRSFTPKLGEFYTNLKNTEKGKNFELVFVSSDRDESSFKEYFDSMPFCALDYGCRAEKESLSKKFGVRGIPTLVIIDGETGQTITTKGREKVMSDPEAFPWPPESFADIFYKGDFIKNDGSTVESSSVKTKVKAVYFSAHWCPPCRGFTPDLIKTYEKLVANGKPFEIIFASSDRDEASFKEYFGTMPWLSLPFGDSRKEKLSDLCGVEGIPTLAIFDENDKKITSSGRAAVGADPEGADFPWKPKPLNVLNENTASSINEKPCLIYITDASDEGVAAAREAMKAPADSMYKADEDAQELLFFYTNEDSDDLMDSLRGFCKLPDKQPLLALVNIPDGSVYEHTGELTSDTIAKVVSDFSSGSLSVRKLR